MICDAMATPPRSSAPALAWTRSEMTLGNIGQLGPDIPAIMPLSRHKIDCLGCISQALAHRLTVRASALPDLEGWCLTVPSPAPVPTHVSYVSWAGQGAAIKIKAEPKHRAPVIVPD